jgi:HPt (histidine-containing phosphotransfer) domain-containing protein
MDVFNSEFATQQLSGNHEVLCRLLTKFIDDYQNAESDILSMLADENFEQASLTIHTLKGVSGNLGMDALHEYCKKAEVLARNKTLQESDVIALTNVIADTTRAVNRFINSEYEPSNVLHVNVRNQVKMPSKVLRKYLTKNQFIPQDTLNNLLESLPLGVEQGKALREAIMILDYEQALTLIDDANLE